MTRLSVNLNDETAVALRDLAARRGVTVTETVRRAVATFDYLSRAQDDGQQVRVVGSDGSVTNMEILP